MRNNPSEHQEQAALVFILRARGLHPLAIPNGSMLGGYNRWGQAKKLQAEGVWPGAPDLILIEPSPRTKRYVAIEMKAVDGKKPSLAQEDCHRIMRANYWEVIVAYGCDDALAQLRREDYRV